MVATYIVTDMDINILKQSKKDTINEAYEEEVYADILYKGATFQADKHSQEILMSTIALNQSPSFWLDKNNDQVPLSFEELKELAHSIFSRAEELFTKRTLLKTSINNAQSPEELLTINW